MKTKKTGGETAALKNPVSKKGEGETNANEVCFGSLGYITRKYGVKDITLFDEDCNLYKALSQAIKEKSSKDCPLELVSIYEVRQERGQKHFIAVLKGGRRDADKGNDWNVYLTKLSKFFAGFDGTHVRTWLLELQNDCRNDQFFAMVGFCKRGTLEKPAKKTKTAKGKGKRK